MQRDAGSILDWLQRIRRGEEMAPNDFNWLGLAEVATHYIWQLNFVDAKEPDLKWVQVAISAYDYIADKFNSDDAVMQSMALRASMIEQLGAAPGDPVLDVEQLVQVFFSHLHLSHEAISHIIETKSAKGAGNTYSALLYLNIMIP